MKKGLQRRRRNVVLTAILTALLFACTGCGSSAVYSADSKAADSPQAIPEIAEEGMYDSSMGVFDNGAAIEGTEAPAEAVDGNSDNAFRQSDRKLIKTVNVDVETKEFDTVMSVVEKEVTALGGYIENSNTYNGSRYSSHRDTRYADMKIRIPKQKLDTFLNTVSETGNVTNRSDNVEDITLAYVDLASHKNALLIEQERLMELLERAETLEDILTIEARLSDVRYQLESMESQLRTFDNQVDYSTVYLNIREVEVFTPVEKENAWKRISEGFLDSLKNIGEGIKEGFIHFIIISPYLLLWAAFVLLLIFLIVKLVRRKNNKKIKNAAQAATALQNEEKQKEN